MTRCWINIERRREASIAVLFILARAGSTIPFESANERSFERGKYRSGSVEGVTGAGLTVVHNVSSCRDRPPLILTSPINPSVTANVFRF